jgi:hypothetical protein
MIACRFAGKDGCWMVLHERLVILVLFKTFASFTTDLIVIQASQVCNCFWMRRCWILTLCKGLCQYVLKNVEDAASRGVVIGHDHRYNSERWAELTAAVFIDSGFKAYLHRGLVHTPMCANMIASVPCIYSPRLLGFHSASRH